MMATSLDDSTLSLEAEYDVFLNFRGPDTRCTFTDFLYVNLTDLGINVFKDDEEIRQGERIEGELLHAIESSKIYFPIFSTNYASSVWCLRELTHMMKCLTEGSGKVIIPIFYDVDPSDVKLRTPLYLDALKKHEESGHDVRQWKEALTYVTELTGYHLRGQSGQGAVIKILCRDALKRLTKRSRNLPEQLVRIHDHEKVIMDLVTDDSSDVRYLVIHGMGGVGKTTLAMVVFNQISNQFEGCSFLLDVRESAQHGRIIDLQRQLLSDMLRGRYQESFYSVDEGINIIRERFRRKKVLLVLDDVDKWDQLSKLAGESCWFGPGSIIIITTRDINFLPIKEEDEENIFQAHPEAFEIHEVTGLDDPHSLKLFSKHAFRKIFPPDDWYDISQEIISKTGGLPLALEVIGSSLYGKKRTFWKDTSKKLDLVPKEEVLNKLKISYDMLDRHQREIFLDIACFFIGKERLYPYYVWKASDYRPKSEILFLTRMSLIKVVENDMIWMHDQLRDLGREMIEREDVNVPRMRSRLWMPKIALEVVQMKQWTDKVMALKLTGLSKVSKFTSEEFSSLPNVKLFELEGGNLEGNFENLLSKLTWLSWHRCPSNLNARNLCLEQLVVLELSDSNITEDWTGWGSFLVSENLKIIRITQCPNLKRTPDFSKCSKLKKLVLQDCTPLLVVDGSLSILKHLKHLQINQIDLPMSDVTFPPIDLATLSQLQILEITCVHPQSLMGLPPSLEKLTLWHLNSPMGRSLFSNLTNLSSLDLYKCQLREIEFDDVLGQQLEKLRSLEVRDSELLERLWVSKLDGLQKLSMLNCPRLQQLGVLPDTCHLRVDGCRISPAFFGDYKTWKDTYGDVKKRRPRSKH